MLLHARQPHIQALELESQAAVVDAQAMEDRGVEVVNVYGLFHDVVTEVVGLAMHNPFLDAAAGKPDGEALGMMVAAVVVSRQGSLAVDCPAELTAPNYQRVVEQPALFQVCDQGVAGLVNVATLVGQIAGHVEMLVPATVEDLDEPDVALDEPASKQVQRANVPGLCTSGPYISRTCFGSFEMSVSSGTELCIRKAISYWAMRVCVSGSAISEYSRWLSRLMASSARCGAGVDSGGV